MAEVESPPAREARGVSRAILEGVYDQGSPLALLQGTPHLLQIIWDFLRAYWAHVIKLPRGIRLPLRSDGVMCADCEERGPMLSQFEYCPDPSCLFATDRTKMPPFYLAPLGGLATFPPPTGININMMPFIVGGKGFKSCRLPKYLKPYWGLISTCINPEVEKHRGMWWPESKGSDLGKVYFLTIQESLVEQGSSQRRPGLHVDSIRGKVASKEGAQSDPSDNSSPRVEGGGESEFYTHHPWGGGAAHAVMMPDGGRTTGYPDNGFVMQGGIYMASSTPNSCRAWDCAVEAEAIGRLGDVEHLREGLPGEGQVLLPNKLYWMTDRTPHESLPLTEAAHRQFFRLVTSEVALWYRDHSTANPLGVRPDPDTTITVSGDKFSEQGVTVVPRSAVRKWKTKIRKTLSR